MWDRNTSRTTADQKVETNWYLRGWRATIGDARQRIRKPLLYPAELRDRALAGWISELRRVGYCRHAAPRPLRRGRDRGTSAPSRSGCGRPGTTSAAATIRPIPRSQSYVGWAKASGTADRFMRAVRAFAHAVGARALVGLRWAKSRDASRRHIGRARRFCPPDDEGDTIRISETPYYSPASAAPPERTRPGFCGVSLTGCSS